MKNLQIGKITSGDTFKMVCACLVGISVGVGAYYLNKFAKRKSFNLRKKSKNSYFSYDELTYTNQPFANTPSDEELKNLELLVDNVLDPLRKKYGKPIHINSGYRSTLVNAAVGGASNSDHTKGMAVDIEGFDKSEAENKKLYNLIVSMKLPFKQLINEFDWKWVHVAYDKDNVKREKLYSYTDKSGKTRYGVA